MMPHVSCSNECQKRCCYCHGTPSSMQETIRKSVDLIVLNVYERARRSQMMPQSSCSNERRKRCCYYHVTPSSMQDNVETIGKACGFNGLRHLAKDLDWTFFVKQ